MTPLEIKTKAMEIGKSLSKQYYQVRIENSNKIKEFYYQEFINACNGKDIILKSN
jgi:hypothetical protein